MKSSVRWLLFEYEGLELVILSKPFKTKKLAENARQKYPERERRKIGIGVVRVPIQWPRTGRNSKATEAYSLELQTLLYCILHKDKHYFVVAKTVLIADDSASVRLSVRLLLQGRHKELVVHEAFDGMDAIEKAKRSKPDLILLDLAMPRVNGAEAATVLKNVLPDTPVILFTYTDLHADSLCTAIGIEFISKVDGIPRLLERVDALLPPTLPNDGATLS